MITGSVTVSSESHLEEIKKNMKQLEKNTVYVGVPEENTTRKAAGDDINNAELVFVHTHGARMQSMITEMGTSMKSGKKYSEAYEMYIRSHGSPMWQIPPRPIIEAAIENPANKKMIVEQMEKVGKSILQGDSLQAKENLKRMGMLAVALVKGWFNNPANGWPPLAESTIARRKQNSSRPLQDTGQLRNSIKAVIPE